MGHTGTGPHGSSNDQFGLPHWPDDSNPIPPTHQPDTMTIIVDNSDNRLHQNIWAHYCAFLQQAIEDNVFRIRFCGGTAWNETHQIACWVCEVTPEQILVLKDLLQRNKGQFDQQWVTVVFGISEQL